MSGKEKISEQLSAYLDGELSQAESRRVDEMVAADPALSAELESLRTVRSLVRNLPPAQAPAGLADAVLAMASRRPAGWWLGHLARAAVILLAVGVGVTVTAWLSRPTHPQRAGPQTPDVAKTPILSKGTIADVGGLAMVTNVFINTPASDLVRTQRQVERVFGKNSVKPIVEADAVRMTKAAHESRGRANFYNQRQVAPNQIRYELAITDNQMRQIVSELNEIRARQNVAQTPMKYGHMKDGEAIAMARADFDSESAADRARREAMYRKDKSGKKRSVEKAREKARLEHSAGRVGVAEDAASQPALAAETPKPVPARSGPAAAKLPAAPTTMPASTVVAQRKVDELLEPKAVHRQAATQATANVRQLVVILNVVGGESSP